MTSPAAITYGPIFVGVVLNILLYGIMITQTFLYFTVYKKDKLWMKLFVLLLFACDTVNTCFDITFLYEPLVNQFGNNDALTYATWVFATDPAMTAIIALLVQLFFAWRVKVLTNNWFVTCFITFTSICQCCGGLGTAIAVGMIPEFVHFQKFEVIVVVWLAFSAVTDTVITLALVWHLRRHKTGFTSSDDVVNKIIRLTVQTGMVTALCATVDLVAFLATPTGIHLIFNLPLSKLYTNSLMSSLNSRAGWKYGTGVGRGLNGGSDSTGSRSADLGRQGIHLSGDNRPVQQVFVDVESHEMRDQDPSKDTKSARKASDFSVNEFPRQPYGREKGRINGGESGDIDSMA